MTERSEALFSSRGPYGPQTPARVLYRTEPIRGKNVGSVFHPGTTRSALSIRGNHKIELRGRVLCLLPFP